MKVLCAADLHIGRRSTKLPSSQDSRVYSCAAAWQTIVDIALREQVDLVTLSGDVIDQENKYFEATGPLERGIERLSDAGITTLAITGNHDFDVLPQVADALGSEHFRVLGLGGEWERYTFEKDGQRLHIDGWSFPRQEVRESALERYELPHDGAPVLGLLHADLDQQDSNYGPVSLSDLRHRPVTLWALGHIHAPATYEQPGSPTVFYPGSPQAMDPGEQGPHGVMIAEIDPSGSVALRRVQTSSVLYSTLSVDLTDVESDEAVRGGLVTALRGVVSNETIGGSSLRCISCRVTVTGRTKLHTRLQQILADAESDLSLPGPAGSEAVVERIDIQTRPALDIDALSKQRDLPGELARMIQSLDGNDDSAETRQLIDRARRELTRLHVNRTFEPVSRDPEPDEEHVRRLLLAEAWTLLDTLIAQREAA